MTFAILESFKCHCVICNSIVMVLSFKYVSKGSYYWNSCDLGILSYNGIVPGNNNHYFVLFSETNTLQYPGVLHCSELRPFWTNIIDGEILEMGQGVYPNSFLLDYGPVKNKDPSHVSFVKPPSSQGIAYWHVKERDGKLIFIIN